MFLYAYTSTVLWFEQMNIVDAAIEDDVARTSLFAWRDAAVNLLTIVVQIFFTGRIIALIGVGLTLAVLPVISVAGFATLGMAPVLPVVITFAVVRRAANFAVSRPAREVLYTPLGRDEKYKAKSLIDTFVYRGSDAIGAWSFDLLLTRVASLSGVAFIAVPFAAVWAVIGVALGRRQRALVGAAEPAARSASSSSDGGRQTRRRR